MHLKMLIREKMKFESKVILARSKVINGVGLG